MILNPLEFLATFLPSETRCLTRTGVQIHDLQYWVDALEPWVGQHKKVRVYYDPRDITVLYVRIPGGALVKAKVTTPNIAAISLAEWMARRNHERGLSRNPELIDAADQSQKRNDEFVSQAKASRKLKRRKATEAAGDRFRPASAPTTDDTTEASASAQEQEPDSPSLNANPNTYDIEGYDHDD